MTKTRLLKSIYQITFSALTVAVGGLFVWQTWSMYFSAGSSPAYTVARISQYFGQISAPVFCWLVALIGNFFLEWILPDPTQKVKAYLDPRERLDKMQKRLPKEYSSAEHDRFEGLRLVFWCLTFTVCAFSLLITLSQLFETEYIPKRNSPFFTENNGIADRLALILILVLCCAVSIIVASCVDAYATKKQISIAQKAMAENKGNLVTPQKKECKCKVAIENFFSSKKFILTARITVAVLGLGFFIFGIFNGGMLAVLDKAVKICTQCIGLG